MDLPRPSRTIGSLSTQQIADAYDRAGTDYLEHADGIVASDFCFAGKHAYADRRVWACLESKLTAIRRRGERTLRVLDAGCGPGTWISRIVLRARELGFANIVARGFDLSAAQIAQARERSRAFDADSRINLEFAVGDLVARLPEKDASVDLTLCLYSVVSHIPPERLEGAVSELARVTRGHVVATARAVGSMPSGIVTSIEDVRQLHLDHRRHWFEIELADGRRSEFDFRLFSSSELARCFSCAFDIERLEGIDFFHNRFAGDPRWNPENLELPESLLQKLAELKELFASNATYIDHANHLLIVGRPRHDWLR